MACFSTSFTDERMKILTLIILAVICICLEVLMHLYLGVSIGYTHFFYVLLVLAAIWYQKKAVVLAVVLAITHIAVGYFIAGESIWAPALRGAMFVIVTLLVAILSEELEVSRKQLVREKELLSESEGKLKVIFNSIQTGIVIVDPVTHIIVEANPVAIRLIGLPAEEIIGKVCQQFICPADIGKCPITDLGNEVDNAERVLLTAKGEKVPIIKTVMPIYLDGRKHLLESFIDITERKKAEVRLKETNERYIGYIKEAAMRLKNPVEVVGQNIALLGEGIKNGDFSEDEIVTQLMLQSKNMEQIQENLRDLNKTIVDGFGELSPASKKFLTE
jgi:PAS domain S-box-containing protein